MQDQDGLVLELNGAPAAPAGQAAGNVASTGFEVAVDGRQQAIRQFCRTVGR